MDNLANRIAKLPPEKRAFLELKLKQQTIASGFAQQMIPRRATSEAAGLSFAQQRLWFLDQLAPDSAVYNIPGAFRLKGSLNINSLQHSLNEIVRRHEVLRTTFRSVEGSPLQIVASELTLPLSVVDLSDRPESEREAEARRLAIEERQKPFDLAQGPLVRVVLLRLGHDDYVLLLTMHHIISDGWSSGILYRELSSLYEAFSQSKPSPLPELPLQYSDFAVWQREWLRGEMLEKQLGYWIKNLEDVATLQLPMDRPRPPVQTFRGAHQSRLLNKDLTDGLKNLGRKEGVTLFMTLLAAFQTMLHRYTRQDDIAVGSPIAGRNRIEIEPLIGFFVNTLVLRSDFSGNPGFRDLLGRVREVALGAYAHQDVPFEKLVEELQPERSLTHSSLFQVVFALQNAPSTALRFEHLTVSRMRLNGVMAKFDLSLMMREEAKGLSATLGYNTDLFDSVTIDRMLGHLEALLRGIVTNPDQRITDLPMLTEAEKHQLLVEWNDTKTDYPKDKRIHELFETQVGKTPDAVALVFEEQQLTYRELNNRANQLAHYLRSLGVGPEVLVGICLDRSIEMIVGLLGILKAGGAYVPLDPQYPKERLRFMIEDAQVSVLLTQAQLVEDRRAMPVLSEVEGTEDDNPRSSILDPRLKVVCLDRDLPMIAKQSSENLTTQIDSHNLAYVIYTSGSSGKPKGVMIQHASVVNFLASMAREPGLTETDILFAVTTLSFDIAGLEIYLPLTVGARVVLARRDIAVDAVRLAGQLSDCGATVMQATPATWRMLLAGGWQGGRELKILCGGEALSDDLAKQLVERCASLWNMYGPTETTIWSSVQRVPANVGRITLGRPIANTRFYVLDQQLQPVPIGVIGELHIAGDGVARGYLNRPELTREKFIPNPFSDDPTRRLYKTGDLARYLHDGNIEFIGRTDTQVKIRGYRIELGEIEAVLDQHPAVRESVVLAGDDAGSGMDNSDNLKSKIENAKFNKRLVAYLVPKQEQPPTASELCNFLRAKLPEYMIPSAFVMLDTLPLTPNGKVDRKSLPAPDQRRPHLNETFIAPRTSAEKTIAGIWAELLKLEKVGIHDNFFDLGGHSLLATKVISRLRSAFQVELSLRALFENPTVVGLAVEITHAQAKSIAPKEMADLLDDLESLSDAEAERLFAQVSPQEI